MEAKFKGIYGKSVLGNFEVVDTIGVPHPYCITPRHVTYAAECCGGILDASAIEGAEKAGAKCDICKGKLSFAEHEQILLIACKLDLKAGKGELEAYLKSCVAECEKHGYAGFTFMRLSENGEVSKDENIRGL